MIGIRREQSGGDIWEKYSAVFYMVEIFVLASIVI